MNAVNWKTSGGGKYVSVTIGALDLQCSVWCTEGKEQWMATSMFHYNKVMIIGAFCSSLAACKEEALKVACEMLENHYVAVKAEMANFGIGEE